MVVGGGLKGGETEETRVFACFVLVIEWWWLVNLKRMGQICKQIVHDLH
jgi:hypothetical protein